MPVIQPGKPRHKAEVQGDALIIRISTQKNYLTLAWAVGMLLGGLLMEVVGGAISFMLLRAMWLNFSQPQMNITGLMVISLFLLALLGWITAMISAFFSSILWQLVGQEIITISTERLKVRYALWRWGWTAEYLAAQMQDLRVAASTPDDETWPMTFLEGNRQRKFLAFDYGAKTHHFCGNVDEAEAKQIYATIVARFPHYQNRP